MQEALSADASSLHVPVAQTTRMLWIHCCDLNALELGFVLSSNPERTGRRPADLRSTQLVSPLIIVDGWYYS